MRVGARRRRRGRARGSKRELLGRQPGYLVFHRHFSKSHQGHRHRRPLPLSLFGALPPIIPCSCLYGCLTAGSIRNLFVLHFVSTAYSTHFQIAAFSFSLPQGAKYTARAQMPPVADLISPRPVQRFFFFFFLGRADVRGEKISCKTPEA